VNFRFGSTAALFFTLIENPPHGVFPLVFSLALRFSFFFSTASVPSGHHWRFGVRSSLPLQRCSRARSSSLLRSPTSLIPKPAMFEPIHPSIIRRRDKACCLKARGHERGALLCFILLWDWIPVFISPFFVNGSDSGAWNGLAMGAARWDFLCLCTVGAFRDVRHIRESVGSV